MLRLGEGHVVHPVAVLVREDDHECLSLETLVHLVRQPFHRTLIGNGPFAGCHDDEEVVFTYPCRQFRQFVPVLQLLILGPDAWETVADELLDKLQRILPAVEDNTALQVAGHPRQPLQPPVESRLELRT